MTGIYTAQRLGDIARLTWSAIDLERKEINFTITKTRRRLSVPMHQKLEDYLLSLAEPRDKTTALFCCAFAVVEEQGRTGSLSNKFHDLLVTAGLAKTRTHKAQETGQGRTGKRQTNELSFHSIRHTSTSMMKNGGVSEAVAMDIVGHESRAISANYTHIEDSSRRSAISKLPDFEMTPSTKSTASKNLPRKILMLPRKLKPPAAA